MSDEIFFDGKRYISAHEAGASADLTRDYIARLCREGKILGRRIGNHWYVEQASLKTFLVTQEYAKSRRSESLAKERTREYQATTASPGTLPTIPVDTPASPLQSPAFSTTTLSRAADWNVAGTRGKSAAGTKTSPLAPAVTHASRVISSRTEEIKNKMALAVAEQARQGVGQAKNLLNAPGGFAHAALSAAHVPAYTISPVTEFIHKVVALTLTLMLTFGTYAAVDPSYARFAADSVRENVQAAVDSYQAATGGGLNELANRTQTQVAAAAENPGAALASVRTAFTEDIPDLAASFARALNSRVNDIVYTIAFPIDLVVSRGIAARNENGSVSVSVVPYQKDTASTSLGDASTQQSGGSITQNIINNPVVERVVETTRLLSVGGISEELLDKKLADLDRKFSSQMLVSSAANTTNITNVYASAASAARIEHLDGLDLTNPTITGGSITGTSFSATSFAVTGTGTSTFANGIDISDGCFAVDGTCLSTGGASLSAANTWTALQLFSAGASTTLFSNFGTAYFGGTATTTIDSTGFLTLPSGFLSQASSTIGAGGQATGLTISGGATTTGNAYFAGNVGISTTSPGARLDILAGTSRGLRIANNDVNQYGLILNNLTFGFGDTKGFGFYQGNDGSGNIAVNNLSPLSISATGFGTTTLTGLNISGSATSTSNVGFNITAGCFAISGNCLSLSTIGGTLGVANGGTGATTFTSGSLLYGSGTGTLQSVATTTATIGGSLSYSGTFGALVGGTAGTLSLNTANANTWTALQSFANASSSLLSVFNKAYFGGTATSTFDSTGALTLVSRLTLSGNTANVALGSNYLSGDGDDEGVYVDSGGRVGLGTATPDKTFSLGFTGDNGGVYKTYNTTEQAGLEWYYPAISPPAHRTLDIVAVGAQDGSNGGAEIRFLTNPGNSNTAVERLKIDREGKIGVGTSSPFAKFSIQSNGGDTATTLFAIGSSTAAFATSTLFSISNTGAISATGAFTSTAGTANTFPYASSTALTATNLFSTNFLAFGSTTLQNFTGINATTTNATSTNFFATTASSTNLFSTTASFGTLAAASLSLTNALSVANGGTGATSFGQGWVYSSGGTGALAASTSPTVNYIVATSTTATTTLAGGLKVGSNYLNVLQNGNIGIGTAAPTVGLDVGVATKISGDFTLSGGSALTISATGPVNQTGTGQVTFAGNVDATNGLDVTNANFTVGGSNFTVAQSTGNTLIAGTLGLTGAFNASSTLQATGAARFYSTLYGEGAITAAGSGTGLSVTNNASIGGTLALTGAGTFSSTLAVSGLLTAATTTFLGDVAFSGKKITGIATPSADQDAANKTYVDSVAQGLSLKDSVLAGTTANITLSGEQTVDGVSLVAGNRVLVKDQTDQTKNGIYVVASGVWSRATDADIDAEVTSGMFTFISDGTLNSSSGWVLTTTGTITLGTSLLTFTQFSGAGQIVAGTGITKSGNTLNTIGTADRITANADSIDIASTYVGQTSITTVGTLTSGSLGSGFGNINIGSSSITGGVATFSSIVGSAINGTGNLSISGSGTFTTGLTVVGTLTAATSTFSGDVALGGKKITGLANPTSAQEAATKAYVDAIAQGLTVKASVRVATTTNITLSGTQTIDGIAAVAGNRVLVMGQSTASQNGIYDVAAGAWSRSSDANENSEVAQGMYAFVEEGTANANTGWSLITSGAITLDTTSLTFTQFSGSAETTAGDGLTKTGNTFNTVGTTNRISVTADAIDIAATYAGQSSLVTVGTLTAGAIGSGFGAINIGSSALTAGASVFSSATSYGTLSVGGTATTSIVGNSATSTFSGGISLATGNVNLATGGLFMINNSPILSASTLGSSVLTSSLTSVGGLDSGSITTGFGAINIGSDTLDAGATTLTSLTVTGLSSLGRASSTLFSANAAYFGGTATSTFSSTGFLTLPSGLLSQASSTIGSGAQAGGLTISGGATTTGTLTLGSVINFTGGQATTSLLNISGQTYFAASTTNRSIYLGSGAGTTSLMSGATGFDNFGVGRAALVNNISGDNNTAIGAYALFSNTTGTGNTALSNSALYYNATGTYNTAIGVNALFSNTGGDYNVAIGLNSLFFNSTGDNNNALGSSALNNNRTGESNNAFGNSAITSNTTGSYNNALGYFALTSNSSGFDNNALGYRSLYNNLSGSNNNALGKHTLYNNTSGMNNTALGYQAGYNVTTGYSNLLLGDNTQTTGGITTGFGNIGLGSNVFFPSATANNQLNIGNLIYGTVPATTTAFQLPTSGSLGVGTSSPFAKFAIQSNGGDTATTLFAIGSSTAAFATSTLFSISNTGSTTLFQIPSSILKTDANGTIVAAVAGTDYVTVANLGAAYPFALSGNATSTLTQFNGGLTAFASSTIGNGTAAGGLTISGGATTTGTLTLGSVINFTGGQSTTSLLNISGQTYFAASTTNRSIYLGSGAGTTSLMSVTGGFDNFGVGRNALAANTTGDNNNALGDNALYLNTTGSNNNAFGQNALYLNTTGTSNNALGQNALYSNTTGNYNTAIGHQALLSNTTGSNNNAFGQSALYLNTTGSYNTALGQNALFSNTTGTGNMALGYQTLALNTTGSNNNVFGYQAGYNVTTGYSNTLIGDNTQISGGITTGGGNIGLGSNVFFPSQTSSLQLNIGNLIFGTVPATSTAFRLPTSGSIGVGTSSPFAKFSIQSNGGDTATTLFAIGSSTAAFATSTLFSISNTGAISATGAITSAAGTANTFPYASTTALTVSGTGFFGDGTNAAPSISFANQTNAGLFKYGTGIGFAVGGTHLLALSTAGFYAIGSTNGAWIPVSGTNSASNPAFSFLNNTGSGLFSPGANLLGISTGNTERVRIDTSGNVGIGTTTPFSRLQIADSSASATFKAQVVLTDTNGGTDAKHVSLASVNGEFRIGTTSDAYATSTLFSITNASTTISKALYSSSAATSSFAGGVNLTSGCWAIAGTCIGASGSSNWTDVGAYLSPLTAGDGILINSASSTITNLVTVNATSSALYVSGQTILAATGGNVGIGTTTPLSKLTVTADGTYNGTAQFVISGTTNPLKQLLLGFDTSSDFGFIQPVTQGTAYRDLILSPSGGNVGIGTTTPFRKFSITDTVSTAQAVVAYDATRYAEQRVDTSGDLNIGASGGDTFFNNDNLWVCTGGSITTNGCPSGSPTGAGNVIVENKIGIGTTTPNWALQVAGTRPAFAISDASAGANLKHWLLSSMGGNLYIGTSTDAYATSTTATITVNSNGFVGVGTSSPTKQLSISNLLFVGAGGATGMGTATSTFQGDIKITGKLDVGTIDPVYTIDGVKYATYGHSTIGIHEETMQTIQLTEKGADGKYSYTIDFDTLEQGSDLWLFYQVTDMGQGWKGLVVSLTPAFDGRVFYKKDVVNNQLIISADASGEVSMRLTAYRYDFTKWKNLRPDQEDDGYKGHEISSKPQPAMGGINIVQQLEL